MRERFECQLIHEYFYKRLTEIDEAERDLISAMRTKSGLVVLCDKLRALELEKLVVIRTYEDFKHFF